MLREIPSFYIKKYFQVSKEMLSIPFRKSISIYNEKPHQGKKWF